LVVHKNDLKVGAGVVRMVVLVLGVELLCEEGGLLLGAPAQRTAYPRR
jgi:hypothetical protein